MNYTYSYLVRLQYLGFRFHGWQKQPGLKTAHFILDKTLKYVLEGIRFKTIGVGRTDAKVSSTDYIFQLFIDERVDEEDFLCEFNLNSPSDVRGMSIEPMKDAKFNLIQHPKVKEYRYYFSSGEKNHPYCAPFLNGYQEEFDIDLMKIGATLFEGYHNFKNYCTKPSEQTKLERAILSCAIVENTFISASFFPKKSYVLIIKGEGFLRNQIRLIMGALAELGKGNYTLNFIEESLDPKSEKTFSKAIAPASGLHLHKIDLKEKT